MQTRLENVLKTSCKTSWRRLEDILGRRIANTSSRRLQEVLEDEKCYAEDVLKNKKCFLGSPFLVTMFFLNRLGGNKETKWKIRCNKVILNVIGTTNSALLFLFFQRVKLKICSLWCSFSFLARKTLNNLLERQKCNHFLGT